MAVTTYTQSYSCVATNVSPTALENALAAQPHDVHTEALLGVTVFSDTHNHVGPLVTRTVVWHGPAPGSDPPIPNPELATVLDGYYRSSWAAPLGTPLTVSAMVVT